MKLTLLNCLLFIAFAAPAQDSFFQKIEPSVYVYLDDVWFNQKDWKQSFRSPAKPSAQGFDSLQPFIPKDGWNARGGQGLLVKLRHKLAGTSSGRKELMWATGLGLRNFKMDSYSFSYYPQTLMDTTKIYLRESEQFQLRQTYLDVYNSISYQVTSRYFKKLFCLIGIGLEASIPLTSKVNDTYNSYTQQWSSTLRRWTESSPGKETRAKPAQKQFIITWSLPVGVGSHISAKNDILFRIEYFQACRTPNVYAKNTKSEGAVFGVSFTHALR